ncbi:Acyl-CoA N-acyltransferases superfamily protein isoform 7 [Hibiscus syriacus]|uniref:N-alpha-acetyltransferase 40 n=1 Tax=Hibiscus syriacus TaxID=106335 RepID=A0A6A3ADM6_HIBSY|nr:N-alpha-acetyltransferase 40-like isoform X2 [Hibiscus syriacus]KAE8702138.1 Acyl-CoA N-acyltransferases superfamily protein isoform 7 [Hibiscus syriacus]
MESSTASEKKKLKRREILEKKKATDQILKAASAQIDHLASFPSFRCFNRNGHGDKLSHCTKQYIQNLLKVNMEGPYGSEWAIEEKVKRREMVAPEARYIFVCRNANDMMDSAPIPLLGFLHYRFTLEEEMPVLYLYELQLDSSVQGKGLGKFLMELIELIAQEKWMSAVVLTVQKSNSSAMKFYRSKLRYVVSSISPSRVNPFAGVEKKYEILCKTFDHEAKAVLEVKKQTPCQNCFQYHLTTLKVLD